MRKKAIRADFINFLLVCSSFFISFFILEIFFRILPASDYFPISKPVICKDNNDLDISCFRRRRKKITGRYIKGKIKPFPIDAYKVTNDLGQFSDIDFNEFKELDSGKIKIISIGDSYVESFQLPNNKTFHGILNNKKINNEEKVFEIISTGFGSSGLAFPNYLKTFEFLTKKENYKNDFVIFTISAGDFDESFFSNKSSERGMFFFEKFGNNIYFEEYLNPLNVKLRTFFIKNSALSRYLIFNIELLNIFERYPICKIYSSCGRQQYNTKNFLDNNKTEIGYKATKLFLKNLNNYVPNILNRKKIIFLVDSNRVAIFEGTKEKNPYLKNQREFFIKKAKDDGYSIIDLKNTFETETLIDKRRFYFKNDSHWNYEAHKLIANEILKKIKYLKFQETGIIN